MSNNQGKNLAKGTIIYAIGTLGSRILSFIIVPLYTYYIVPSELGIYDLLQSTVNLLTPIISMQIADAAYVWMVQGKENNKNCIEAVYKYIFCISLLTVLIISVVNIFWNIPYCFYFIGMLLTNRWMATLQKLLRGLKRQKLFASSGIIYTSVFLILNLIQIIILKMGVISLFQSSIIANIVVIFFILIKEKTLRTINIRDNSWNLQKEFLKFSIPVVPNQLNWWIVNSSDRYIVRFFLGSVANGIYSIAYKFPSVLQMFFQIFYQSWQDSALGEKVEDGGIFYTKVFKIYYNVGFTILLPLIPFTKIFIELVMNQEYRDASSYISFLYLGTVFQAFSNFMGVGYLKSGKTAQASSTTVYGAVINIVVNIALIKFIGLHAASISTFVSFLAVFFIRAHQTRDSMKIIIDWKKFVILFAVSILMSIICIFSSFKTDVYFTLIGGFFFIIFNRKLIQNVITKVRGLIQQIKRRENSEY